MTAVEAWQEQAQWPEVTARVERCGLDRTSAGRPENYRVHCRLSYTLRAEQKVSSDYWGHAPSRAILQYPANQIAPLEEWVVLAASDLPRNGRRTANNIRLLAFWAVAFVILPTIVRIARPQPDTAAGTE